MIGRRSVRLMLSCINVSDCVLAFEPEGATTSLKRDQPITVEVSGPQEGVLEISYWPDGISINAWPGAETRAWDAQGNKLDI